MFKSVYIPIAHHEQCHRNRLFSKYVPTEKEMLDLLVDQEELQKLDEYFSTRDLYVIPECEYQTVNDLRRLFT